MSEGSERFCGVPHLIHSHGAASVHCVFLSITHRPRSCVIDADHPFRLVLQAICGPNVLRPAPLENFGKFPWLANRRKAAYPRQSRKAYIVSSFPTTLCLVFINPGQFRISRRNLYHTACPGRNRAEVMASTRRTLVALTSYALLARGSCQSLQRSSCKFSRVISLRAEWKAGDEPCQKKLPFDLWTIMKADGSEQNPDAQYVRENCIQTNDIALIELITPEGYTLSETLEAAPGDVVSETPHATTYAGATAATFEAFCEDDNIVRVTRVFADVDFPRGRNGGSERRLQTTTSEAGQAHQVAELIAGLDSLGCQRTTGENQTVCVMSDSFDALGNAAALQASGDLPAVEVVKENLEEDPDDEGKGSTSKSNIRITSTSTSTRSSLLSPNP